MRNVIRIIAHAVFLVFFFFLAVAWIACGIPKLLMDEVREILNPGPPRPAIRYPHYTRPKPP